MEQQLNSESLLESASYNRFKGAPWFDLVRLKTCYIGGVGGIGSWLCPLLTRIGVYNVTLIDPDIVEPHNLGGQLFFRSHIGGLKSRASQQVCFRLGCSNVSSFSYRIQDVKILKPGVYFSCFDNMEARNYLFKRFKEGTTPNDFIFIDGRLTADEFQVFCVPLWDEYAIKRYEEESFFSDEEATPSVCTFKQTSYMAAMIGSVMVNVFIKAIQAQEELDLRTCLPFKISYNSNTMKFKKEV